MLLFTFDPVAFSTDGGGPISKYPTYAMLNDSKLTSTNIKYVQSPDIEIETIF